jgi:NAD(P)-dependent dehydrogenase (short-subunit alcohol dehydrogenase family)
MEMSLPLEYAERRGSIHLVTAKFSKLGSTTMRAPEFWLPAIAALGSAVGARYLRSRARRYDLRGKTALVSGGTRGLGYLLARELCRRGAQVFVFSRDDGEIGRGVEKLRSECSPSELSRIHGLRCDVRDPEDVAAAVSTIVHRSGRLDVVVNNAGIIQVTPFENARIEDFEDSMRTHFWGPLYMIRAALPYLRRERGRILNISSIGGRVGVPHLSPYCAGKFALVGLSEVLRAELSKDHITVTTATPGLMRTGSHVRVTIRGNHRREAKWFAAGVATSLTSMSATRAARIIVDACVAGRAHVTPGIQARIAEVLNVVAPELTSMLSSLAVRGVLPRPGETPSADQLKTATDVGFGWMAPFLPNGASRRNNELLP